MREAGERYRFGYQGEFAEQDDETGWNAFELRMYDSKIGRWMATDPYGQHWSPYVGMGNNPINGVDPDGGLFGKWRARRWADNHDGDVFQDAEGRWWGKAGFTDQAGTWEKNFGHNGFGISANQFEFSVNSNVNFVVNMGLLGYKDYGVNGVKVDIASVEMLKWGAKSGFNTTTGKKYSSSGIENYIFKDGNIIVKSGVAVESIVGDIKFGNKAIINYNNGFTVKNDIRAAVGRPWIEGKYTRSHSGIHEFRFGVQEDFGGSYGPIGAVLSGFAGFTIKYKPN